MNISFHLKVKLYIKIKKKVKNVLKKMLIAQNWPYYSQQTRFHLTVLDVLESQISLLLKLKLIFNSVISLLQMD